MQVVRNTYAVTWLSETIVVFIDLPTEKKNFIALGV